jgi:putative oxidoreductase
MRDAYLLATRLVVGGYLAVHGAQKLFGVFGGHGLDKTAAGFERMGLRPGRPMAVAAGITELGGGVLTAAGIADPAGPLAIMGTMAVATTVHREKGPMSARGGFELPLTNLVAAAALTAAGPGRFRIGPGLPRPVAAAATVGGALVAAGLVARMLTAKAAVPVVPAAPPVPATPADQEARAGTARQAASDGRAATASEAAANGQASAAVPEPR